MGESAASSMIDADASVAKAMLTQAHHAMVYYDRLQVTQISRSPLSAPGLFGAVLASFWPLRRLPLCLQHPAARRHSFCHAKGRSNAPCERTRTQGPGKKQGYTVTVGIGCVARELKQGQHRSFPNE
jgi:hypothetical protein